MKWLDYSFTLRDIFKGLLYGFYIVFVMSLFYISFVMVILLES
jgi:hypothetical protein